MKKHKKLIKRAFLILLILVAGFGIHHVMSSRDTAEVTRNEARENSTSSTCGTANQKELETYYKASSDFDIGNHRLTISVLNGTFRATSVSATQDTTSGSAAVNWNSILATDPTTAGTVSADSPLVLNTVDGANGTVTIHFVLAASDDRCTAYDEAPVNDDGVKANTYEFDAVVEINSNTIPSLANTNYNGICAVFRTGQGYDQYADVLKGEVSKSDIEKYNYNAVSAEGKSNYNDTMAYCLTPSGVTFNYTEKQTASMIGTAISIWKKMESGSSSSGSGGSPEFLQAFNDTKQKALARGHDYSSLVKDGSIDDTRFGHTCDWKLKATGTTGDEYYVNKDYYYAKEEESTTVNYNYEYTSRNKETVSGGSCVRTCEEAVVVEYGPPVASKAGLCFEYKVKVTSRVVCNAANKISPPTTPQVCTPVPYCNNFPGLVNDAGPSEEFDQCIQECDGGKYGQECSNKCYQEVYGDDESESTSLGVSYEGKITASRMSNAFPGYAGRYEWNASIGRIVWMPSGRRDTYGRWYQENKDAVVRATHGNYLMGWGVFPDMGIAQEGFRRQIYTTGPCKQDCRWIGCSNNQYWNAEDAADDTIRNWQIYEDAVASCNASASCTSKTAYFTISVDYTHDVDGKEVEETVEFPVDTSNNQATLPSLGESQDNTTVSGEDIFLSDYEDYKGYDGCYVSGDARNWYQAEWSFPGTWINNKTGEITYKQPGNEDAWHLKEDKFCVPLDAKSVNTTWWEWSEVNQNCYTGNMEDTIDYNIHASTTDFGYFGWNFDFECFYALKNEVCDVNENGCCSDGGDEDNTCTGDDCDTAISPEDFAFRIVDTNELFPENDTNNSGSANNLTGRTPGYNWSLGITDEDSSILTMLNTKNPDYHIDPLSLISDIQERGRSIYSGDEYLDYSFVLDKQALAAIRSYNRGKNYTDYEGKSRVKNGVTVYESSLINEYADKQGTPGVNNDGEGE